MEILQILHMIYRPDYFFDAFVIRPDRYRKILLFVSFIRRIAHSFRSTFPVKSENYGLAYLELVNTFDIKTDTKVRAH